MEMNERIEVMKLATEIAMRLHKEKRQSESELMDLTDRIYSRLISHLKNPTP